jgi:hypothetical protein
MLLIDRNLNHTAIDVCNNIENVWCTFNFGVVKYLVGVIYRPPNSDENYLLSICETVSLMCSKYSNYNIVITGDFNLPNINWDLVMPTSNDKLTLVFLNCVLSNNLEQIINFPTRGNNVLDLVLCKNFDYVPHASVESPFILSDHECIKLVVDVKLNNNVKPTNYSNNISYNFRLADYNRINNYLNNINWFLFFSSSMNVEELWNKFMFTLFYAISLYVPRYRAKRKFINKIPKFIRKLIWKKKRNWSFFRNTGNLIYYNKYRALNKLCKKKINENKRFRFELLCNRRNLKAFYNCVNCSLGRNKPSIFIKSKSNGEILNNIDAANEFAKFFYSTYVKDNNMLPDLLPVTNNIIDHIAIDVFDIKKCLDNLPNKYSFGPDGVPLVFLKKLSNTLSVPLALFFQKSIETSKIPDLWKHANVVPVYKGKGDKFDFNNYRPISLTSNIGKILETLIHKCITFHCEQNNLINKAQHGFRQKHSTTTNLLELLNEITLDVNNGHNIDLITVDFSKAFDSISHNKLLHKLYNYGIRGKLLLWIKEFLNNRTFNVILNKVFSTKFPVVSSVPQGSKLGPLFYILYANDLSKIFKYAKLKMYADDLSIYAIVDCYEDFLKLQEDLNELCKWSLSWSLNINYNKCKLIHFGHGNLNFSYNINGFTISLTEVERILGVLVDSKLNFKEHIYTCVKKAYCISNLITNNLSFLSLNTRVSLFKCYVRPVLEYNSVIFSPHNIYLIDVIENVQRHFTKKLPQLFNLTYVERLHICNLEQLELRRLRSDLIMLYKILHNLVHVDLIGPHCLKMSVNTATRGNRYKLVKHHVHLDIRKYFFCNRVVNVWNSLNDDIVCSRTVNQFVHKLYDCDLSSFLKGHVLR